MIGLAAEERNRVQKVPEDASVKIGDVLSDVFGLSGQWMLEALVEGNSDAADIAHLAKGNAKKKITELTAALEGAQMRDAHRRLIRHAMRHMAFLAGEIEALGEDIRSLIESSGLTRSHTLLQGLPGIQETAAAAILAERGPEMKQFPEAARFTSWAGLAPGNNQSADKRKRAPTLKGNPHIKAAVVEAAWSASRTNGSEFRQRYERLRNRLGHERAIVDTVRILAIRVYETLASGAPVGADASRPIRPVPYECPADGLPPRHLKRLVRHHTRRLKCRHRSLIQGCPDSPLASAA